MNMMKKGKTKIITKQLSQYLHGGSVGIETSLSTTKERENEREKITRYTFRYSFDVLCGVTKPNKTSQANI